MILHGWLYRNVSNIYCIKYTCSCVQETLCFFVRVDAKPMVECSFVTDFKDHIYVSMDAEVFLFIHDLVTSYIKEKEKGLCQE